MPTTTTTQQHMYCTMTSHSPHNPNESDLATAFHTDGYLLLPNQFSPTFTSSLLKECSSIFAGVLSHLFECGEIEFAQGRRLVAQQSGDETDDPQNDTDEKCAEKRGAVFEYPLKQGIKHGYREIVMRSPGRYEVALLVDADGRQRVLSDMFNNTAMGSAAGDGVLDQLVHWIHDIINQQHDNLHQHSHRCKDYQQLHSLLHTVQSIFHTEYTLTNLSLVLSTPGSPSQPWHSDGPHASLTAHLPAHVLNIFVPLVDVPLSMGPTEIRPGSQYYTRDLTKMMLGAMARKELRPSITPELKRGDCLLFDWRVLHRGRANTSHLDNANDADCTFANGTSVNCNRGRDRPILVMSFAKSWFVDVCNFPKRSIFDLHKS